MRIDLTVIAVVAAAMVAIGVALLASPVLLEIRHRRNLRRFRRGL